MSHDPKPVTMTVPAISTEFLVREMARQLLAEHRDWDAYDEEGNELPRVGFERKEIGKHLRAYLDRKLDEAIDAAVTRAFDDAIRARIAAEVERQLAEGWTRTDQYGNATGQRVTLRERVNEQLTRGTGYNSRTKVDELAAEAIGRLLNGPFAKEVEAAQAKFRAEINGVVQAKLVETIKSALGLR